MLDGSEAPPDFLETGLSRLHHRGPDDSGTLVDGPLGMGARRLAVIDSEGGHQPLHNEDGTVSVVFNGEIYNHTDLRRDLTTRGHQFRTMCDTEVLVHLYEEDHDGFLQHLNGMFALAIWDRTRRRLLLARDRTGMKPLFVSEWRGALFFSSEMKALLALPSFPTERDHQALNDYFAFYYVTAPRTLYKNIRRVMPGEYLTIESGTVRSNRYWNYDFTRGPDRSLAECAHEFTGLLDQSVKRHLQSDVPVGAYLSGGLDSASIVAMMARHGSTINTYSVGYHEDSYSELDMASLISRQFATNHHEFILTPDDLQDLLPQVIRQLDEPHGDWTNMAISHLSQKAREDVTVVLSGAGGDELFGGYPTLVAARMAAVYRIIPALIRRRLIRPAVEALPTSFRRMSLDFKAKSFVAGADERPERAHYLFKQIFSIEERRRLFTAGLQQRIPHEDAFHVFEHHLDGLTEPEMINRLMYLDLRIFLPDCILYSMDIMTSAHSLECRAPFLDTEMLDFAASVPWKYKTRGLKTKYLIRQAMRRLLPAECVTMPKKGFLVPIGPWLRGPLHSFAGDIISSCNPAEHGLNRKEMDRLLEEHRTGIRDHSRRLSCLISYLLWVD